MKSGDFPLDFELITVLIPELLLGSVRFRFGPRNPTEPKKSKSGALA